MPFVYLLRLTSTLMATGWPVFLSLPFLTTANPASERNRIAPAKSDSTANSSTTCRGVSCQARTSNTHSGTYLVAIEKILHCHCKRESSMLRARFRDAGIGQSSSGLLTLTVQLRSRPSASHSPSGYRDQLRSKRQTSIQPRNLHNSLLSIRERLPKEGVLAHSPGGIDCTRQRDSFAPYAISGAAGVIEVEAVTLTNGVA